MASKRKVSRRQALASVAAAALAPPARAAALPNATIKSISIGGKTFYPIETEEAFSNASALRARKRGRRG